MTDTPIYEQLAAERFRAQLNTNVEAVPVLTVWERIVERLRK